jgi:hypothetical protein
MQLTITENLREKVGKWRQAGFGVLNHAGYIIHVILRETHDAYEIYKYDKWVGSFNDVSCRGNLEFNNIQCDEDFKFIFKELK